jgi:hypothetical protein
MSSSRSSAATIGVAKLRIRAPSIGASSRTIELTISVPLERSAGDVDDLTDLLDGGTARVLRDDLDDPLGHRGVEVLRHGSLWRDSQDSRQSLFNNFNEMV